MNCTWDRLNGATIRCVQCRSELAWTRAQLPRRNCPGVLDWRGKILIRLRPGDGVAWCATVLGLAWVAAAWQAEQDKACQKCKDRQRRWNLAWQHFVYRHFCLPRAA